MTGRRPFLGRHSFRAAGKNVGDAGIVFQKWKRSCVSDTYGFELWVRNRMKKNVYLSMWVRSPMSENARAAMQARSPKKRKPPRPQKK